MANEKRLIDANAVLKHFDGYGWGQECDAEIILDYITEDAPTVDAVEVIRCKDCKHGNNFCARGKRKSTFCHRLGKQPVRMEQDDFCSYGERKDNE